MTIILTYKSTLSVDSLFKSSSLLELDITFVLHECGVPWYTTVVGCQLCIEVTMCWPINCHPLVRTISITLSGIKESSEFQDVRNSLQVAIKLQDLPKAFRRVRGVSHTNPECGSRFADSQS
jgi:hypothetical protein